jgi:protease I
MNKKLDGKNIVMIIASKNFRDEEYFTPFEIFQREGAKITTASSIRGDMIGIEGGEARAILTLKEVKIEDFDAFVFVGGSGAVEYFDNNEAHRIINEAIEAHKILAAICIAPVILARAGVLRGKKATVWSSILDKSGRKELEKAGCAIEEKNIVIDEKIITANGPSSAEEFAKAIVNAL